MELEVMRTEKKKVMVDGLERIQEDVITVFIPENRPCSLCGSNTTKTLAVQHFAGNVARSTHEVERSTHLGSSSSVIRDYMGNVTQDLRKEDWRGSGKCRTCHGTGKETRRYI